ncbi:hypothetical protein EMIT0196MI5_340032 [Pseudomonas sp. IT-196MI5]
MCALPTHCRSGLAREGVSSDNH